MVPPPRPPLQPPRPSPPRQAQRLAGWTHADARAAARGQPRPRLRCRLAAQRAGKRAAAQRQLEAQSDGRGSRGAGGRCDDAGCADFGAQRLRPAPSPASSRRWLSRPAAPKSAADLAGVERNRLAGVERVVAHERIGGDEARSDGLGHSELFDGGGGVRRGGRRGSGGCVKVEVGGGDVVPRGAQGAKIASSVGSARRWRAASIIHRQRIGHRSQVQVERQRAPPLRGAPSRDRHARVGGASAA